MIDPAFFRAVQLPGVRAIEAHLRPAAKSATSSANSITTSCCTSARGPRSSSRHSGWTARRSRSSRVKAHLAAHPKETVAFRGLPNARLQEDLRAVEALQAAADQDTAEAIRAKAKAGEAGIEPEDLWAYAAEQERAVAIMPGPGGSLGAVDAVFGPVEERPPASSTGPARRIVRPPPTRTRRSSRRRKKPLVATLREFLEKNLPRLHGAVVLRGAARAAEDAQRQDQSQGAAAAQRPDGHGGQALRRAAQPDRDEAGGNLAAGARPREGRHQRPDLRDRRRLAAHLPDHRAGQRGRPAAGAAAGLPVAHHRGTRRGDRRRWRPGAAGHETRRSRACRATRSAGPRLNPQT